MNPYLANKAALHPDRLLTLKRGEQPAPVHVLLVLSDLCNQDCGFCLYRIEGHTDKFAIIMDNGVVNHNPNRMIATEKAREIIYDAAQMGVKAIELTGGGEPTVHPDCKDLMLYAQSLGIETAIITNGIRLDKVIDSVLSSTWIRVSLDAGCRETYCNVRRVPEQHWDRVLSNVRELVKQRGDKRTLTIGMNFVVHRDNYREVVAASAIARDLGVDNFRITAMIQPENAVYFNDFHSEAADLCRKAQSFSSNGFEVLNLFGHRMQDLQLGFPEYRDCSYQHLTTYIGADLNVYHCCITAYTDRGLVGSLKDRSFKDLWSSTDKRERYRDFDARECPRCQFNDRNREIARLVESLPTVHGNFV